MGIVAALLCIRKNQYASATTTGDTMSDNAHPSPILICAPSNAAVDEIIQRLYHHQVDNTTTTSLTSSETCNLKQQQQKDDHNNNNNKKVKISGVYDCNGNINKIKIVRLGRSNNNNINIINYNDNEDDYYCGNKDIISSSSIKNSYSSSGSKQKLPLLSVADQLSIEKQTDTMLHNHPKSPYHEYLKIMKEMDHLQQELNNHSSNDYTESTPVTAKTSSSSLTVSKTKRKNIIYQVERGIKELKQRFKHVKFCKIRIEQEMETARMRYRRYILMNADVIVGTLASMGSNIMYDLVISSSSSSSTTGGMHDHNDNNNENDIGIGDMESFSSSSSTSVQYKAKYNNKHREITFDTVIIDEAAQVRIVFIFVLLVSLCAHCCYYYYKQYYIFNIC